MSDSYRNSNSSSGLVNTALGGLILETVGRLTLIFLVAAAAVTAFNKVYKPIMEEGGQSLTNVIDNPTEDGVRKVQNWVDHIQHPFSPNR